MSKNKTIQLNGITSVEFFEKDVVIDQAESIVIIDHDEILKICEMILTEQKLIN